jgi:hypothetical protein
VFVFHGERYTLSEEAKREYSEEGTVRHMISRIRKEKKLKEKQKQAKKKREIQKEKE